MQKSAFEGGSSSGSNVSGLKLDKDNQKQGQGDASVVKRKAQHCKLHSAEKACGIGGTGLKLFYCLCGYDKYI